VREPGVGGIPWFFIAIGLLFSLVGGVLVVVLPRVTTPSGGGSACSRCACHFGACGFRVVTRVIGG
jgi:hypothetical protein